MRRNFMALVAAVGLGITLLATGPVGPAAAAPSRHDATADTYLPLLSLWQHLEKEGPAQVTSPGIEGADVSTASAGGDTFILTGGSGNYREIKDSDGYCLDLVGSGSGGIFYVNEEFCNNRVAELWLKVAEGNGYYQLINDYGTSLLGHDACMWNPDPANEYGDNVEVRGCASHQPQPQQWTF